MSILILFDARGTTLDSRDGSFLAEVPDMLDDLRTKGYNTGLWTFELPPNTDRAWVFPYFTEGFFGRKSTELLNRLRLKYTHVILVDDMPEELGRIINTAGITIIRADWEHSGNFSSLYNQLKDFDPKDANSFLEALFQEDRQRFNSPLIITARTIDPHDILLPTRARLQNLNTSGKYNRTQAAMQQRFKQPPARTNPRRR